MNKEEQASILADIKIKKKELMIMRIKRSSGEVLPQKEMKKIRKDIARSLTKLNVKIS